MGVFKRRPLCMFCLIFLAVSALALNISLSINLVIAAAFALVAVIFLILSLKLKKYHVKFMTVFLCLAVTVVAFLHSSLFTGIPRNQAKEFVGERKVLCYVTDDKTLSEDNEYYVVKIKNIDGKATSIKSVLSCDFKTDLESGDEIYGLAYVDENKNSYTLSDGCLLDVSMSDPQNCYVRYTSEGRSMVDLLLTDGGVEIVTERIADFIKTHLNSALGEEKGALAMGFFTGEREGISADVTRDFRRTGLSHIMAVSGSHIAILLGSIDFLLKKFYVDKKYRCVLITAFSIVFLFVSGFTASACRSVLMLYAVYLGFFLNDDSDSLTSLFTSVSIIILLSPFSVLDLGLWMSFFATLGLITVYNFFEEKIPYPRKKKAVVKKTLIILRETLLLAMMTIISNMFLLPIIWYYFGEISIVSVLGNIVISPLSSFFLISVPIMLALYKIPIFGSAIVFLVSKSADAILYIVNLLSRIPNATVSLKYGFCTVIIILFTASMLVLLTVEIRRKYLIVIPMVGAVAAFAICITVTNIFFTQPTVVYTCGNGSNEIMVVKEGSDISFCDNSSGGAYSYRVICDEIDSSNATEIKNYVLTHYHESHVGTVELITQYMIVRNIYIPEPETEDDMMFASAIVKLCKQSGINVVLYDGTKIIPMSKSIALNVGMSYNHDKGCSAAFYSENKRVIYTTPQLYNSKNKSEILLLGGHGIKREEWFIPDISAKKVMVSSQSTYGSTTFDFDGKVLLPIREKDYYRAEFCLD